MTDVVDRLAAAVNAHDLDAVAGLIHQDFRPPAAARGPVRRRSTSGEPPIERAVWARRPAPAVMPRQSSQALPKVLGAECGCGSDMHYASLPPARYPDGMRAGSLLLEMPR